MGKNKNKKYSSLKKESTAEASVAADKEKKSNEPINSVSPELANPNADTATDEVVEKPSALKNVFCSVFNFIKKLYYSIITHNELAKRMIGLYLIFSAYLINKNYNAKPRIGFSGDNWQNYVKSVKFLPMILFILLGTVALTIIKHKWKRTKLDTYILAAGIIAFGVNMVWRNNDYFNYIAATLVTIAISYAYIRQSDFRLINKLPKWSIAIWIGIVAVGVTVFIASMCVYQHKAYGTSCYDMGIFVQMYHSLITNLTAVTTCERDRFLSHFAVHFSPIYYLLVPFYFFFPKGETLVIAQSILVMSGVIPLYLILKKYKFTNVGTICFCGVYTFCAALIGPCFYDFHENAFLPPLLMWLFYAFEKKKYVLLYIMMILVAFVKEDAPIYLICIGLYFLLSNRRKIHGFIVTLFAGSYFMLVTSLMSKYGEGVMTTSRFGCYMIDPEGGFIEIIKTCISDPAYLFTNLVNEDKLKNLVFVMLPLLFIPFCSKKASRIILFAPFLIMNLAPGYAYSALIGYQYMFGPVTFLIYLTLLNVSDLSPKAKDSLLPVMCSVSILTAVSQYSGTLWLKDRYIGGKEKYDKIEYYLDIIPEDGSVQCDTWLIPHAANRADIRLLEEHDAVLEDTCDFVVIRRDSVQDWHETKINLLISEGYKEFANEEGVIVIYVSLEYMESHKMNIQ